MSFNNILALVKKNFKNLIRTKASSLVIILGPLFVIFLAGLAFDNTNIYSVKIGAYIPTENELTQSFETRLASQFQLEKFSSEQSCVDAIKDDEVHTCLVFSKNFTVGEPSSNEVTFYVDYSRLNLVWTIMNVMTTKISSRVAEVSRNLTKTLLSTLDYTQSRISNQRDVVVRMTTENDLISRNAMDLEVELGDIDLSFNPDEFGLSDLSSQKTKVKHWVENALSISEQSLSEATKFISAAESLVSGSTAGSELQEQLVASFQKSVDSIKELKGKLSTTKDLADKEFAEFDTFAKDLQSQISETKSKLDEADTSRLLGIRVIGAVRALLDKSLISILEVQNALNEIENRISEIQIRDPEAITQPIVTNIKPVVAQRTYLNYIFPVLIVLVIMFTSLLLAPTLILLEKNSLASFRTFMTPTKDSSRLFATFLTCFLILLLQLVVIMAITSIFFSASILANLSNSLVLLLIVSGLFIFLGMIIGYGFNSEETAILASISLGSMFLFISDVIIPIESMTPTLAKLASYNPFVLGSDTLRRALLFNTSLVDLGNAVLTLLGYVAFAMILAVVIYYISKRKSFGQALKKMSLIKFVRKRKESKPKTI